MTGGEDVLEGVVGWTQVAQGSKSERETAVLLADDGQQHPLYVIGDNPFMPHGMKGFEGQRVRMRGSWRRGTFRLRRDAVTVLNVSEPRTAAAQPAAWPDVQADVPVDDATQGADPQLLLPPNDGLQTAGDEAQVPDNGAETSS